MTTQPALMIAPAIFGAILLSAQAPSPRVAAEALFEEFQAICLDNDGAPDSTTFLAARQRGYMPSQHLIPDDLFQGHQITLFSRVENGVEWRVTTMETRFTRRATGEVAPHTRCYVSAAPGDLRASRALVAQRLEQASFQQRGAAVFAWVPTETGHRRPVRRSSFERNILGLMNEEGLRFVTVARHKEQVTLGYVAATQVRERCVFYAGYRECRRVEDDGAASGERTPQP